MIVMYITGSIQCIRIAIDGPTRHEESTLVGPSGSRGMTTPVRHRGTTDPSFIG